MRISASLGSLSKWLFTTKLSMRHVIKIRSKQLIDLPCVVGTFIIFCFVLHYYVFFAQLLFILYLYALFTGIYPFGRINCVNLSLEDIKGVIRDRKSKDKGIKDKQTNNNAQSTIRKIKN
jgi:hypothetical protein